MSTASLGDASSMADLDTMSLGGTSIAKSTRSRGISDDIMPISVFIDQTTEMATWFMSGVVPSEIEAAGDHLLMSGKPGEFFIRDIHSEANCYGLTIKGASSEAAAEDKLLNFVIEVSPDKECCQIRGVDSDLASPYYHGSYTDADVEAILLDFTEHDSDAAGRYLFWQSSDETKINGIILSVVDNKRAVSHHELSRKSPGQPFRIGKLKSKCTSLNAITSYLSVDQKGWSTTLTVGIPAPNGGSGDADAEKFFTLWDLVKYYAEEKRSTLGIQLCAADGDILGNIFDEAEEELTMRDLEILTQIFSVCASSDHSALSTINLDGTIGADIITSQIGQLFKEFRPDADSGKEASMVLRELDLESSGIVAVSKILKVLQSVWSSLSNENSSVASVDLEADSEMELSDWENGIGEDVTYVPKLKGLQEPYRDKHGTEIPREVFLQMDRLDQIELEKQRLQESVAKTREALNTLLEEKRIVTSANQLAEERLRNIDVARLQAKEAFVRSARIEDSLKAQITNAERQMAGTEAKLGDFEFQKELSRGQIDFYQKGIKKLELERMQALKRIAVTSQDMKLFNERKRRAANTLVSEIRALKLIANQRASTGIEVEDQSHAELSKRLQIAVKKLKQLRQEQSDWLLANPIDKVIESEDIGGANSDAEGSTSTPVPESENQAKSSQFEQELPPQIQSMLTDREKSRLKMLEELEQIKKEYLDAQQHRQELEEKSSVANSTRSFPLNHGEDNIHIATYSVDGSVEGSINGSVNGSVDGNIDGTVDGTVNGSVNGSVDGNIDGTVDGTVNGSIDGAVDDPDLV